MLIAALVLAFVAFLAFVNYIASGADWSLFLLYGAAGLGLILFIADWWVKQRSDRTAAERKKEAGEAFGASAGSGSDVPEEDVGELPDPGETR